MGPNNDGADDQPIADMLRMIEPARREVGDGEAAADGAARVPSAPPAATPPVSKGTKRKVGASGYRGVAFHQVSGKYRARITSSTGDGRQRALPPPWWGSTPARRRQRAPGTTPRGYWAGRRSA